jgi:heme exporter protein D
MSYVYAGYGITLVSLGAYTVRLLLRERSLRRRVEGSGR